MLPMLLRRSCVVILALSAAACGGSGGENENAPPARILARSVSDEMLPLDAVQSQAPLAQPEAAAKVRKRGEEKEAQQAEEAPPPMIDAPPADTIGDAISASSGSANAR